MNQDRTPATDMSRRRLLLCAATAISAGLAWWLWPVRQKPNFLLVTLDTTRADRIGCYGYRAGSTPALDALAENGVLCERAFTVAPITLPSHTSMFTGLYPPENGIFTNGRGRLDESIPTLAEVLKHNGYETAAFVASFVLNAKFGLDLGFETYDDDFTSEAAVEDVLHRQRSGQSVVDAALKWLGLRREKPFFCWVHLYDPHAPYLAYPELFGDKYVDRPYDAEIAYVDLQVQRLIDYLKQNGLEKQTLVVVVGDHGEGLGEHVEQEHGMTLYDDTLHVPLIFRHAGQLPGKRRIPSNVSLVDLSPTVLDLLGLRDPRKITGRSLKNAIVSGESPAGVVYGATDAPFLVDGWSPMRCLIDGNWKYIRSTKPELYDLAKDPHERQNLFEAAPDTARDLESRLTEFMSRLAPREEIAVQLTSAERRKLEQLGYLIGAKHAATSKSAGDLPDVKDMLPFNLAVQKAMKLADGGSPDEAIEQLREVIRQAPRYPEAYWHLSSVLRKQDQFDEAGKVLHSLLAVRPDCSQAHFGLALIAMEQGRPAEAIPELRDVINCDPENADAHNMLGTLLYSAGETDKALAHFNAALAVDPQNAGAYEGRAALFSRTGRVSDAIADYRMAVKYAPETAETLLKLGVELANAGETEEGSRHMARAVELNPRNPEMRYIFGLFLVQHGRPEEAIDQLTAAVELKPDFEQAAHQLESARKARDGKE